MEYEKILFSRLLAAVIWTIALLFFPICIHVFITKFDLFHPLQWLVNSTATIFSLETWFSMIPIYFFIFTIGFSLSQELKGPRVLTPSRFNFLCSIFTKAKIFNFFFHVVLGIAVPWRFLNLNNITLLKNCQESRNSLCLIENSVFLYSCGVWTGVYYFIRFDILVDKHLHFPIVRQLRFLQIKSKYSTVFWSCLTSSIVPVFYYLPFYMWYEEQLLIFFESLTSSVVELTVAEKFSLFKLSVIKNAWLISTVYFLILETLKLMIEVHFTEHYSFALIKEPHSKRILLATALRIQCKPIIQHLAAYDLYILSRSQKPVRHEIFTLSQPGGHPHTWNSILHESLMLINRFIDEIESIYRVPEPEKPKSPIPRHIHMRDMTIRNEEIINGPVPLSPISKMKNLVESPPRSLLKEQQQQHQQQKKLSAMNEMWSKGQKYGQILVEIIKKNPLINYVFGTKPDAQIRFLLSNSQPLIWVVQSIAELSANALLEDQFGIVLKDLPVIINTLLRLKLSLDKLGNIQKKFQKRDQDLCMKAALKSALKRSLYRVAIAYSGYLTDLPLPPENLRLMQNFVNFKEC